jgi:arginine-tRNA-protein transferase
MHLMMDRESKRRKTEFDLTEVLHDCEISNIQTPPSPHHAFEVTLEPDTFTTEK